MGVFGRVSKRADDLLRRRPRTAVVGGSTAPRQRVKPAN